MTSELEDLILEFPLVSTCEGFVATCAQQGFCAPFINAFEVYTFLVKYLTYLKFSVCNQTICSFVILTILFFNYVKSPFKKQNGYVNNTSKCWIIFSRRNLTNIISTLNLQLMLSSLTPKRRGRSTWMVESVTAKIPL